MKISVVTVCFNQKAKVERLYASLLQQKEVFEWIVCDDGSTDGTWERVCQLAKESPFTLHCFAQNHTKYRYSRLLNLGLEHAKGDIILVVNGDSYLDKNSLETLSKVYLPDTAGCAMRINVNADESFHSNDYRFPQGSDKRLEIDKIPYYWAIFSGNGMILSPEHIKKVGLWDEEYEGYGKEDYDYFMRLGAAGIRLICYNAVKIFHFNHDSSQDSPENDKRFALKIDLVYGPGTLRKWKDQQVKGAQIVNVHSHLHEV